MTTFDLFVYGTLRSGAEAVGLLDGCERIAEGTVRGILYDIDGRFPAVVLYGDAPVYGEVWRCPVSLLAGLDRYEGTTNSLFRRVAVEVETEHAAMPCWIYVAGPSLSRKLVLDRRISSGDWAARPPA
jgi:gamma-glutamylcyclotransferase (GGCT)/AIG2-like uncharacterized protein YtfP